MALNSFIPAPNHPQPSLFGVLAQVSRALSNFVRPSAPSFFPGSIPQIHTKPPSPEGAKYPSTGCSPVFSFIRSFVPTPAQPILTRNIRAFVATPTRRGFLPWRGFAASHFQWFFSLGLFGLGGIKRRRRVPGWYAGRPFSLY